MGQDLIRCNLGGDNRFCYAYGRIADSPEFSVWIYQFYLRHWAGAITKPEGHDFGEGTGTVEDNTDPAQAG